MYKKKVGTIMKTMTIKRSCGAAASFFERVLRLGMRLGLMAFVLLGLSTFVAHAATPQPPLIIGCPTGPVEMCEGTCLEIDFIAIMPSK